jgi:pilus assembly protein CpaB
VIVVVLIIAIGIIFVISSSANQTSSQPTAPPPPVTTNVIVAARDIPRGTRLSVQDVTVVPWPLSPDVPLPAGALVFGTSADTAGLEQVDKRIARVDILQGQPVLDQMLTPGSEPTSLTEIGSNAALLIPAGQVAIAFPVNRLSSVAYALRPGDHVDVLMSFRFVDVDPDFQTILPDLVGAASGGSLGGATFTTLGKEADGPFGTNVLLLPSEITQRPRQTTALVVDNAIVLRVGDWPLTDAVAVEAAPAATPAAGGQQPADSQAPPPTAVPAPDVITLVVSRQDALVLKFALETGADIDLVLRSVLDNSVENVSVETVTLQYLMESYNVTEPPKLPIALEPRIDLITKPNATFDLSGGAAPAP